MLAQKNDVTAVTTTPVKADKLNRFISPIHDKEIERFFEEAREGKRQLTLHTTTDKEAAYSSAEIVIIAAPTNYNDEDNSFDTTAVEDVMKHIVDAGISVIIYEPTLECQAEFAGCKVVNDLDAFKAESDVIIANRFDEKDLQDSVNKVYTRDIFRRD